MLREAVKLPGDKGEILLMDSISLVQEDDRGRVVVSGSHGGVPSAEYALKGQLRGVVFNDAGIGKESAGIQSLSMLDLNHIMAVAVDCQTAKIGDARDLYERGILSSVNNAAERKGLKRGITVKAAVEMMTS